VRPVKPEAMDAYLEGIYLSRQDRPGSEEAVIRALLRGIEIQPDFAMAYVRLADAYDWADTLDLEVDKRQELHRQSTATVLKALELDGTLAEAHSRLGLNLLAWDWDWASAERELNLALELNPNEPFARYRYALWLDVMGRYDESSREHRRAIELDPLALHFRWSLGMTYIFARRYNEAIREFQEAVSLSPGDSYSRGYLSEAFALKGMYQPAAAELEKWRQLRHPPPSPGMYEANLAELEALAGNRAKARKILQQNLALMASLNQPEAGAVICATVGLKGEALRQLEKVLDNRDLNGPRFIRGHPGLDSIRSDARFQDLLRRMNFPP
jgi:tetratricopeptide (TPR) repeat protein